MAYDSSRFIRDLDVVIAEIREMLIEKNESYGDSALEPVQIFSLGLPKDALIRIRMDDKINRILNGKAAGEDAWKDLIGYAVLYRIMQKRALPPET